jgi:subtilisin family serine protease
MSAIQLTNLQILMERSSGSSKLTIGLIDGPVNTNHPELRQAKIKEISGDIPGSCMSKESIACMHGTFIAGMLVAKRGSPAPAICPACNLLVRPVFAETMQGNDPMPAATAKELSGAMMACMHEGAQILNLSLVVAQPSLRGEQELKEALDYAASHGVIIVAAAGNDGNIGSTAITRHPWVIPVVATNAQGKPLDLSNLGSSIGRRGLSAPGENITSLGTEAKPFTFTGTSAATPFVTGAIALLWSLFPDSAAGEIKNAITQSNQRSSIVPPLLNAWSAYQLLSAALVI